MFKNITDALKIKEILSQSKSRYSAYAGYFCSYFPVELLHGMNIHPVKILGHTESNIQKRDILNYMCAYVTDIIGSFEADAYPWADRIIIPATCDSLYGAKDYFERNLSHVKVKLFRLPLKFTLETYHVYKGAVEEVLEWLSEYYEFDNALLRKSIKTKNKINNKIKELMCYEGRFIMGAVYLKLMLARSVMPSHDFMNLLDMMDREDTERNFNGKRSTILLLGPICDNMELIDYINSDRNVITKHMSSTLGLYDGEVSLEGDIKDNLIKYYFRRVGTATSYNYFNKLVKELDHDVREYSVKGVIYLNYKYCEPHIFFSKQLQDYLKECEMRVLYLETEHSEKMDALTQNKIDAFLESI
jgi:benzoyl-CoA reductase subunit C